MLYLNDCAIIHTVHQQTVAGIVSDITVSDDTVVSWLPPVPPNCVILYYNIRIIRADTGTVVKTIEELNVLTIDISDYIQPNNEYTIEVKCKLCVLLELLLTIIPVNFQMSLLPLKYYNIFCVTILVSSLSLTISILSVQIQAVTSVGGGMFSSPVIISYNNNDDTRPQNSSTVIIGLSVSVAVLILLLLIAGTVAVIYIM